MRDRRFPSPQPLSPARPGARGYGPPSPRGTPWGEGWGEGRIVLVCCFAPYGSLDTLWFARLNARPSLPLTPTPLPRKAGGEGLRHPLSPRYSVGRGMG